MNWREDLGMNSISIYEKRFAFFPVVCQDSTRVWFKHYYVKYQQWGKRSVRDGDLYGVHTDREENITEAEYIVRKLTEGF